MKKLTIRQFATVKRVAQNVNPLVVKKNKLAAKITELNAEYEAIMDEIAGHEAGVKAMTGGMVSEELVTKVVEPTGKVDKDGNPIKVTKYVPAKGVSFNEEENCYYVAEPVIAVPDPNVAPYGSDFDVDTENLKTIEND